MSAEAIAMKWVLPGFAGTRGFGAIAVAWLAAAPESSGERYGVLIVLAGLFSGLRAWVTKRLRSQLDAETQATLADAKASREMAGQLKETNLELRGLRADAQMAPEQHAEASKQMSDLRGDVKDLARERRVQWEQTQILRDWQEN